MDCHCELRTSQDCLGNASVQLHLHCKYRIAPTYRACVIKAANKHVKVLHFHNTAPEKQIQVHVETQRRSLCTGTRFMSQQTHRQEPRFSGVLYNVGEQQWSVYGRPLPHFKCTACHVCTEQEHLAGVCRPCQWEKTDLINVSLTNRKFWTMRR